ncbi:MAG TPA: PP2C family protein-serine/threonine phosphatase [Spirochaetota bacterium]|nr:PP2C family protein-serine/threonine phosphatase [Spirochaetota bacterium]HSA13579.1 PP2C family protein-serine/threonine phosphatase [Spirochaetota bacterium]
MFFRSRLTLSASVMIVSLVFIFNVAANAAPDKISLQGKWKINLEDGPEFSKPDYDDSSWDSIGLPGTIIQYALKMKKSDSGILWIRKTVRIDAESGNRKLGLILGRIACADETYFNGCLVGRKGKFPPDAFSMWNHPRHYFIPASIIRPGEDNVIAVRISYFGNCDVFGKLAITGIDEWESDSITQTFLRLDTGYIIIAMGTPFFFIFLIFFIRRKNEEYLYYCLQLFFGFFIVFDLCTYWNIYGSMFMRLKLLGLAWVGLNVAHPIFLHRIYGLRRKRTEAVLWIYFSIVLFIDVVFTNPSNLHFLGLLLTVFTTPIGLYNISCHVSALYKKSPYSKLFSFFGITVIAGAIHDGLVHFSKFTGIDLSYLGLPFQDMIFHYTAAVLFTGTSLILVNQFINAMDTVEDLNVNLEKKVLDRTEELLNAKSQIEEAMVKTTAINEQLTAANRELEKSEKRHEMDMRMAGNVQAAFFMAEPPESDGYDIAFMSRPLTCVSGDFYDFYYTRNRLNGVGLFDVSGHGISSGLITLLAKSIISRVYNQNPDRKISAIMELANRELISEINNVNYYVTGILLRLDEKKVEYVNSGHPDLLLRSARSGMVHKITDRNGNSITGPFLGVKLMNKPFNSVSFTMKKNDCLLVYSDCLTEMTDASGAVFDETKLRECFAESQCNDATAILDHIAKSFFEFIGDESRIRDDLTVMVVKKTS